MQRRRVLAGVAGLGTAALAGCLGGSKDRFTLEVAHTDFGANDEGYLSVTVTVSNVGNDHQEGTLYVDSKLNDRSLVRVREVALDAHETGEYSIDYDVKWADVRSFSPNADVEPND
ncbi:MAG: hypothetical protein ABEJ59_01065 [Halanaeroarchaeum sp.]